MSRHILELFAELFFVFLYPFVPLFFVLSLRVGIFGWLVYALFLTPPTALWYYVMKKRAKSYLKLLMAERKPWDVKKAVEEYVELQKTQRSNKKAANSK